MSSKRSQEHPPGALNRMIYTESCMVWGRQMKVWN